MERALVELLMSHSTLALVVSDVDGFITLSTPALEGMVGGPLQGLTEDAVAARVSPHDSSGRRPLQPEELPLARARRGEIVIDQIWTLQGSDGKLTYLRCNAAPLREPSGRIRGAICLVQNVTADWAAVLGQTELRDRLVTTVNHGLRTPMTIILGHAELMNDAMKVGEVPEPLCQSVTAINQASHQLADLAKTITGLVDLEGASSLHRELSDLALLVRDVGESRRDAASAAGLALRTDIDGHLEAEVDVILVRRAIGELLDNAIAFAPPRSDVTLQASALNGVVEVRVADHGPGISPHERSRLVQPFEHGTRSDPSESSPGLGLAFACAVASAHGGALTLEENGSSGLVVRLGLGRHQGPNSGRSDR